LFIGAIDGLLGLERINPAGPEYLILYVSIRCWIRRYRTLFSATPLTLVPFVPQPTAVATKGSILIEGKTLNFL
jgi:hypothetical protein